MTRHCVRACVLVCGCIIAGRTVCCDSPLSDVIAAWRIDRGRAKAADGGGLLTPLTVGAACGVKAAEAASGG